MQLTEEMVERGAAKLWAMAFEIELEKPRPWETVGEDAKKILRNEIRQLWDAMWETSSSRAN